MQGGLSRVIEFCAVLTDAKLQTAERQGLGANERAASEAKSGYKRLNQGPWNTIGGGCKINTVNDLRSNACVVMNREGRFWGQKEFRESTLSP